MPIAPACGINTWVHMQVSWQTRSVTSTKLTEPGRNFLKAVMGKCADLRRPAGQHIPA